MTHPGDDAAIALQSCLNVNISHGAFGFLWLLWAISNLELLGLGYDVQAVLYRMGNAAWSPAPCLQHVFELLLRMYTYVVLGQTYMYVFYL